MGRRPWWKDSERDRTCHNLTTHMQSMKKYKIFSAGLLTACLALFQTGQARAQTDHTLLWKVSGKGLSKPSYLFGTMHVLCADDAHLSEGLRSVIAKCEEVYFEIDLSDMGGM